MLFDVIDNLFITSTTRRGEGRSYPCNATVFVDLKKDHTRLSFSWPDHQSQSSSVPRLIDPLTFLYQCVGESRSSQNKYYTSQVYFRPYEYAGILVLLYENNRVEEIIVVPFTFTDVISVIYFLSSFISKGEPVDVSTLTYTHTNPRPSLCHHGQTSEWSTLKYYKSHLLLYQFRVKSNILTM